MLDLIITPAHLPALKWAAQAVRTGDRQILDGVYAILKADGVLWVGTTHYRLLGSQIPVQECGMAIPGDLIGWGVKIDHRKVPDPDTGKNLPSDLDGLKGALLDGQSAAVELDIPPEDQVLSMIAALIAQLDLVAGEGINLPGARDPIWKGEDGKPVDFLMREVDGEKRYLGHDHVAPFKGKTMHPVNPTTWGYSDPKDGRFGLIAERKEVPPPPPVEAKDEPVSAWAKREEQL